jgi:hypothetical protein
VFPLNSEQAHGRWRAASGERTHSPGSVFPSFV